MAPETPATRRRRLNGYVEMSHSKAQTEKLYFKIDTHAKHWQRNPAHTQKTARTKERLNGNKWIFTWFSVGLFEFSSLLLFRLLSFLFRALRRWNLILVLLFQFRLIHIPLGWHSVILNENNDSLHFQRMEMCSLSTGRGWQWRSANVKWGNQKKWPGKKSPRKHWNAVGYLCGSRKWRATEKNMATKKAARKWEITMDESTEAKKPHRNEHTVALWIYWKDVTSDRQPCAWCWTVVWMWSVFVAPKKTIQYANAKLEVYILFINKPHC